MAGNMILWPLCKILFWIADRKARHWFTAPHPHWDCKAGRPQAWSVNRYGNRPQTFFYERWERRRQAAAKHLGIDVLTIDEDERRSVRLKYGIGEALKRD